jgi:flagellar hook-length control protein FliK
MSLESLFSSKNTAVPLSKPAGVATENSVARSSDHSVRGRSDGEGSFSNMLNRKVERVDNADDNQIQDFTVKANKADDMKKAEPKAEPYVQTQESSGMDEFEGYQMAKEMEELKEEAAGLIEYISSLLGISAQNVDEVIMELLKDGKLITGEAAEFLATSLEAGADNVQLIKMEAMVELLKKTVDYLSSAEGMDPEETLFSELLNKGIIERQNEFKGLFTGNDDETKKLQGFAKVVGIVKAAVTGAFTKEAEGEAVNASANALSNASVNSAVNTAVTDELVSNTEAEVVETLKPVVNTELMAAETEGEEVDTSQKVATSVALATELEGESEDAEVTKQKPVTVLDKPLSEIGSIDVKAETDTSTGTDTKESVKENLKEPLDKLKGEDGSVKKNDILESMKVNVIRGSDELDPEPVNEPKLTTDTLKGIENIKVETTANTSNINSVLNVKATPIMDRSMKIDIITQIMDKARSVLKNGQNMMKIQLKPERLGEVFMRISVEDGRVMAKVTTESLMAKDAIETNLYQLKESLSIQGIKIDKFNVFVGDKWQEQKDQNAFNNQQGSNGGKAYKEQTEQETLNGVLTANALPPWLDPLDTGQLNFIA